MYMHMEKNINAFIYLIHFARVYYYIYIIVATVYSRPFIVHAIMMSISKVYPHLLFRVHKCIELCMYIFLMVLLVIVWLVEIVANVVRLWVLILRILKIFKAK